MSSGSPEREVAGKTVNKFGGALSSNVCLHSKKYIEDGFDEPFYHEREYSEMYVEDQTTFLIYEFTEINLSLRLYLSLNAIEGFYIYFQHEDAKGNLGEMKEMFLNVGENIMPCDIDVYPYQLPISPLEMFKMFPTFPFGCQHKMHIRIKKDQPRVASLVFKVYSLIG